MISFGLAKLPPEILIPKRFPGASLVFLVDDAIIFVAKLAL
jgi:hypothetical protein